MDNNSNNTGGNNIDGNGRGFYFVSFRQNVGVPNDVFDSAMNLVSYYSNDNKRIKEQCNHLVNINRQLETECAQHMNRITELRNDNQRLNTENSLLKLFSACKSASNFSSKVKVFETRHVDSINLKSDLDVPKCEKNDDLNHNK